MKLTKKQFVINLLRRGSYRWPPRNEALKNARVARNQYKCAHCEGIFGRKEVSIDHIHPVVDPDEGFTGWDSYVERMYCELEGFQILCDTCHDKKTAEEKEVRKASKKKPEPD